MNDLFKREKLSVEFVEQFYPDADRYLREMVLVSFSVGYSTGDGNCIEDLENCRKKLQEANDKINKLEVKVEDLEREIMGDNW